MGAAMIPKRMVQLTQRENELLKLRFGVNASGVVYTQRECARIFEVGISRIRRIEQAATAKLVRAHLGGRTER